MSDDAFPITIWHNPSCGTSRNVLAIVKAAGYEPDVIEYLRSGWDRVELETLLQAAGLRPRDALRKTGGLAGELGLLEASASDETILDAMIANPSLVNRPFVRSPRGAKLARPSEAVLDILERRPGSFIKEDGEVVRIT